MTHYDGFVQGAAIVFVADMDVDCDGIDYKCQVR
jgi:chitosanase